MRFHDDRFDGDCSGVRVRRALWLRRAFMKSIYFLLVAMVAMTFGASAFELSTRDADPARTCVYTMTCR